MSDEVNSTTPQRTPLDTEQLEINNQRLIRNAALAWAYLLRYCRKTHTPDVSRAEGLLASMGLPVVELQEDEGAKPDIETRMLIFDAKSNTVIIDGALQNFLNDGFRIVFESNSHGHVYIRLERDNVAYAEQKRWEGLTTAERISENINALGLKLDAKGDQP